MQEVFDSCHSAHLAPAHLTQAEGCSPTVVGLLAGESGICASTGGALSAGHASASTQVVSTVYVATPSPGDHDGKVGGGY